jgi:hypothetical protein
MDDQWVIGIASAVGVGIGLAIHRARQSKQNESLGTRIEAAIRERGPRTLAELSEDLGMKGIMGRGKIFNALNELVPAKRIERVDAPEGTPQLKKVDFIRYKLPVSAATDTPARD